MDDAGPMGPVESIGNFDCRAQRLVEIQRTAIETSGERLALEMLHHEVIGAVVPADVVERTDVRVRQRADRLGFPLEAVAKHRIARQRGREDLTATVRFRRVSRAL
jgi:hypothetical protein